jgi:proteasome assembly chaperone (PAC2) family protein
MTEHPPSLVIENLPAEVRRPILLAAFGGWNDAAECASGAVRFLLERCNPQRLATIHPEEFYHFGLTRPEVHIRDGSQLREIRWPTTDFYISREPVLPRDVIFCLGSEPHLKWKTFCGLVLEVARKAGVDLLITFGALLADVPHTRPVRVTGVASRPDLATVFQTMPTRYEGPTGIVGVLNDASRRAGMDAVSLWASVPHYVSEVSNPHATLALVRRLLTFLEWQTDLSELEEAASEFDRQLARIVAEKPEVARYIHELEERHEGDEEGGKVPGGDLPSATQLIKEVEQFLRDYRGEAGKD